MGYFYEEVIEVIIFKGKVENNVKNIIHFINLYN